MALKRNEFIPGDPTQVLSSPSGLTNSRLGTPYNFGGLMVGDYFDLMEAEAQALHSNLHSGRYRFVQIDSGATAANIKRGTIGLMASLAKGINVITSFDKGLAVGTRKVVFLSSVTAAQVAAGAYVFVQEAGDASVLTVNGASGAVGDVLVAASGDAGAVSDPNQSTQITYALLPTVVGNALAAPASAALVRCLLYFHAVQG